MTAVAIHPVPSWPNVALEQIRAMGLRTRAAGALLVGALALYAGVAIRVTMNQHAAALASGRHYGVTTFEFTPQASIILTYFALLLPAMLWHDEKPKRRMYHLSMPVGRSTHALTKALAGWFWLMAGTALFVGAIVVVDLVTRQILGPFARPAASLEAWEWLVPFTTVTIAYALSAAAAIGAETPAVWIVGPPILYAGASVVAALMGHPKVSQTMLKLFSGFYGAGAAMGGTIEGLDAAGRMLGPSAARWIGASVIWGSAAALVLYLVSRRRGAAT